MYFAKSLKVIQNDTVDGNVLIKFADDTYMILPEENSGTCTCIAQLTHIDDWAEKINLWLNCAKAKEIIFRAYTEHKTLYNLVFLPILYCVDNAVLSCA